MLKIELPQRFTVGSRRDSRPGEPSARRGTRKHPDSPWQSIDPDTGLAAHFARAAWVRSRAFGCRARSAVVSKRIFTGKATNLLFRPRQFEHDIALPCAGCCATRVRRLVDVDCIRDAMSKMSGRGWDTTSMRELRLRRRERGTTEQAVDTGGVKDSGALEQVGGQVWTAANEGGDSVVTDRARTRSYRSVQGLHDAAPRGPRPIPPSARRLCGLCSGRESVSHPKSFRKHDSCPG